MKLYQVTTVVKKDESSLQKMDSFYVAENLVKVIEELDLKDKAAPIIGINEIAPVSKIIQ